MVKYTEEQLLEVKDEAYVPQAQILEAFNKMIEEVKEHAAAEHEKHKALKWSNGDTYIDEHGHQRSYHHMNRRRASRSGGNKPNLRKKSEVDQDGWETLAKPKKSFGAEEGVEERNKFRDNVTKARPNNKNLGSSKPVDHREIISDKQTRAFNAFEALEGDDDE
ncbi:Cap-associated protein CAF20 [Spathaspora sp. JA1]|nr:Cap-associated protein CAF20 [Spathaspora sp. JA1]